MRRWLATGVIVGLGLGGYLYANGVPGSKPVSNTAVTANAFVVASGGSPSCTRSSTKVTFANASGHICGPGNGNAGFSTTGWDNACWVTTGGDTVAVKAGSYSTNGDGAVMDSGRDCSNGTGAAVNPNAVEQGVSTGTTANWVTYVCADSPCGVKFPISGANFLYANFHVIISGAFEFNSMISIMYGGESPGQQVQNLQFVGGTCTGTDMSGCMKVYSIFFNGPKNVMFKNIDSGARIYCGKNDANVPSAMRCSNFSTLAWANQFSNNGSANSNCGPGNGGASNTSACGGMYGSGNDPEGQISQGGSDTPSPSNIRLQNYWDHDEQVAVGGAGSHAGCFLYFASSTNAASNVVLDGLHCERIAVQGPQNDTGGITYENSVFGCSLDQLDQTSPTGKWDSCNATQGQLEFGGGANILLRYNTFLSGGGGLQFGAGSYSSVSVVGNLFMSQISQGCGTSGITVDSNTFGNGVTTCGTNATSLSAGDPLTQSSIATAGDSWGYRPLVNARPDGSPAVTTYTDNLSDTGNLNLGHDSTGAARTNPTHAGAYN